MNKHSHISSIFDNTVQSQASSPDVFMSMRLCVYWSDDALYRSKWCGAPASLRKSDDLIVDEFFSAVPCSKSKMYIITTRITIVKLLLN